MMGWPGVVWDACGLLNLAATNRADEILGHLGCPSFDRRAIRLAVTLSPSITVLTTPDWLKRWAEVSQVPDSSLSDAIRRIRTCARYGPPPVHPLKSWWDQMRDGEDESGR